MLICWQIFNQNEGICMNNNTNNTIYQSSEINLLDLSDEILVKIFGYLSPKEIKSDIRLISKKVNFLLNNYLLDEVYKKSPLFIDWQKKYIEQIRKDLMFIKKENTYTLFQTPPHLTRHSKNLYHKKIRNLLLPIFLLSILALANLAIFALLLAFYGKLNYKDSFTGLATFSILCISALLTATYLGINLSNIFDFLKETNRNYLDINISENFLNYLNNHITVNGHYIGSLDLNSFPTIGKTLIAVENNFSKIVELASMLQIYLQERNPDQTNHFLTKTDFEEMTKLNPELPAYAKHVSSLWSKSKTNSGNESLTAENVEILIRP